MKLKPVRETTFVAIGKDICLRPHCGRPAYCRDLCFSDYQVARKLIADEVRTASGQLITWEYLEKAGRCAGLKRTAKLWFLAH